MGMYQNHMDAFWRVASELHVWIVLREPNPLSFKWIGSGRCVPKMVECKAKTADNPQHKFAGLVVSPVMCPEAFMPATMPRAKDKWKKFTHGGNSLPGNFTIVQSGEERGLVKFGNSAIHADFDLMYICKADVHGRMMYTTEGEEAHFFFKVKPRLNLYLKSPMIQHGTEFQYKAPEGENPIGAAEQEYIIAFGPGPGERLKLDRSYMVTEPGRAL